MNFEERKSLVAFLSELEVKYSVDNLHSNGIFFWPVLKNLVFFDSRKFSKRKGLSLVDKLNIVFRAVKNRVRLLYAQNNSFKIKSNFNKIQLPEIDVIFAGGKTHRMIWNGESFNRYFDPLMDNLYNLNRIESFLFEYHDWDLQNCHKEGRVSKLKDVYLYFNQEAKASLNLTENVELVNCLVRIENETKISQVSLLNSLEKTLQDILTWKKTWLYIFSQTKAKAAFGLCYYNNPMYGMNLAAAEIGIPTVDMQHGGQGLLHPAYSFARTRPEGYNLLPQFFWCWDKPSNDGLNVWISKQKVHKSFVGGNPWMNYLLEQDSEKFIKETRKIVLCTLTLGIKPILEDFIVNAIKKSDKDFIWWLRYHPRVHKEDILELNEIIKREGIENRIEMKKANELPLPIILKKSLVHISQSSGSIGEAAMVKVPINIITDVLGKLTYQDLLDEGSAVFYDVGGKIDLFDFIKDSEQRIIPDEEKEEYFVDYKSILDNVIAKN